MPMGEAVSVVAALVGGLLSFFSPCVLPLVPVYLGYISGVAVGRSSSQARRVVVSHALVFVLGFSLIFALLGAAVGLLGQALNAALPTLTRVGGVVLVVLGLQMAGVLRIPALYSEKRWEGRLGASAGYLRSLLIGMIFAAGWTPCVGPVLTAILLLAMQTATAWRGAWLLLVFAAGLGIPFVVTGALLDVLMPRLKRIGKHAQAISVAGGILLIVMGFALVTGLFTELSFALNAAWFS
jgi:cytochrome c-type biogenesis protein